MARITVEDCLQNVDNRFELVMVASKRARALAVEGKEPHLEWENDKNTVMALREIAAGLVDRTYLEMDTKSAAQEESIDPIEALEQAQVAAAEALGQLENSEMALAARLSAEIAAEMQAIPANDSPSEEASAEPDAFNGDEPQTDE